MSTATKRCVIIESPYSGNIEANVEYARRCMQDSLKRGESPFLSHLLYTQHPQYGHVSDDDHEKQCIGRDACMEAAFEWTRRADAVILYTDLGISSGMERGMAAAMRFKKLVEYRTLSTPESTPPSSP